MLKEIILINSANFDFAQVSLTKDLFFLGDNGSGKTSFIRAIHFLYTADVKSLGIPNDKEGFKEYYFKYDNSYIIYIFEEFFIFLYKKSNEIYKYFSKQKFDLKKIVDTQDRLVEFNEIRAYLKQAPLSCRVGGVGEYSDIIYGKNKKYLDFKIADIGNKELFLKLFNAVFNVDKAIIDAKSIKKALLTSIDFEASSKYFDPNEYLQIINHFLSMYKFFNEIEKNTKNIDKIKAFKEEILDLEDKLLLYSGYIIYKKEKEIGLIKEAKNSLNNLEKSIEKIRYQMQQIKKIEKKYKEKIDDKLNSLSSDIKTIKKLKQKFSKIAVKEAKELILDELSVSKSFDEVNSELLKLKMGLEDKTKSIENEISSIKYKIANELPNQKESKFLVKMNYLNQEYQKELQKVEFEVELKFEKIDSSVELLDTKAYEAEQESHQQQAKFEFDLKQIEVKLEELEHQKEDFEKNIKNQIQKQQNLIKELELANHKIKIDIENIKQEKAKAKAKKQELKTNEENFIKNEIKIYENMIQTKPNSFKEFLEEEVNEWQSKLYPIIDEKLLEMELDILKPKLIDDKVIGIKVDTTNLKKILPKDEAFEFIQRFETKLAALDEEHKSILYHLNQEEEKEIFEQNLLIEQNNKKILSLNDEINLLENKLNNFLINIKVKKEELFSKKVGLKDQFAFLKEQYKKDMTELKNQKERLKKEKRELKNEKIQKQEYLKEKLDTKISQAKKELQTWFEKEKNRLANEIEILKQKKESISKDSRINELEKIKESLQNKQKQIDLAKLFLDEFEKEKEFLNQEEQINFNIKNYKEFKKRFLTEIKKSIDLLTRSLENKKIQIKQTNEELDKYLKGIDKSKEIEIYEVEPKKSDKFLLDLIEEFEKIGFLHKNKVILLKELLSKINKIKGLHQQDIYFDINLFEQEDFLKNISNILINIDELIELKNIRLDQLKKQEHKRFENFVKNLITQKLSVLENTQDKFLELVAKVNKKLKSVNFGVIKEIKIQTQISEANSIAKMLRNLKDKLSDVSAVFRRDSLFFDQKDALKNLNDIEDIFYKIKKELKSDKISLTDTIELGLSFMENGVYKNNIIQIKNESSTGGSMLLKIALAISILKVFIKEAYNVFFLIVDEVSRLHSTNQKKLKNFANEAGFKIIFVTPEPVFANTKELFYYKFCKNNESFEVIELNR